MVMEIDTYGSTYLANTSDTQQDLELGVFTLTISIISSTILNQNFH